MQELGGWKQLSARLGVFRVVGGAALSTLPTLSPARFRSLIHTWFIPWTQTLSTARPWTMHQINLKIRFFLLSEAIGYLKFLNWVLHSISQHLTCCLYFQSALLINLVEKFNFLVRWNLISIHLLRPSNEFTLFIYIFGLAECIWDLGFPIRDWTFVPYSGSTGS